MEHRSVGPKFGYEFKGERLREGDVVVGLCEGRLIDRATVVRPECPEFGFDQLRGGDYRVQVKSGNVKLLMNRSHIVYVLRPYQAGDWAA